MTKQDIDQSYTSWLIYSDYLEENGELALAEQIRFELDYRPVAYPPPYPPPYTISGDGGSYGNYDVCLSGVGGCGYGIVGSGSGGYSRGVGGCGWSVGGSL